MTDAPLSMAKVAARLGLSTDRLSRVWRSWARDSGFPVPASRPAVSRNHERLFWDTTEVEAWIASRKAALSAREVLPPDTRAADPIHPHHLARHRARLEQLMETNQP